MLRKQGLETEYRYGDYSGNGFTNESERLIVAGHAR